MSYAVEWIWGVVVFAIVLLLVFVPWFAAIAVVLATIAVLVVALAALVGLLALAAAALASPYLLVRNVRRRVAQRRTRRIHSPSGIRSRSAAGSPAGLGRPHLTALANDEPDEAGAILEDVTRHAA
jgi:membrane protein implicated in regulation of membrane protease activity